MENKPYKSLIPLWEFAQVIDVSPSLISKLITKGWLREKTHYKRFGRSIMITVAGQGRIVDRNTKAGRPKRNGGGK